MTISEVVRHAIIIFLFCFILTDRASSFEYEIMDVGTLGGEASWAKAINNNGLVTGYSDITTGFHVNYHAYLYASGTMTDCGYFDGSTNYGSDGNAINNLGQVVGSASFGNDSKHAFFYSGGSMIDLGTLGGSLVNSVAFGINDLGDIVGYNCDENSQDFHAFLYTNGSMVDLELSGAATAINNSGWIVGTNDWDGFLYRNGSITDLGILDQPCAINDIGQIVGYNRSGSNYLAYLYDNGTTTYLGSLFGKIGSVANDINGRGQIVGECYGNGSRAFLYEDGVMKDLTTMIDPATGWILYDAHGINDAGWIVGAGNKGAFLLVPIPEPSSLVLMATFVAGLLLLAARNWAHFLLGLRNTIT